MPVDDAAAPSVALAGSLAEVPLDDVLRTLARRRADGILHLSGNYSSIICLREGGIYLAHAETAPSLRHILLVAGVVDEARWDEAVAATSEGRSLVRGLLEVAGADQDRLRRALYEHTVSTLFELLVPNDNQYRFGAGEVHQLGSELLFPVDDVLDAASTRLAQFTEIARSIPSTDLVMRVVPRLPDGVPKLTISATEWQILAAIDGRATVAELTSTVGHSAFTVFSALHRLLRSGAIERVDRP